ncbi:MAG: hypothetical protein KF849_10350 [Rhizobiaceae bacterium]|nr:hypothetical protein [Rhizobiaceae bacterium]
MPGTKANSVFVFGGLFTTGYMGESIVPFTAGIEGTAVGGVAYQRHLHETPRGFRLGSEIGIAGRFGPLSSAEMWMGISLGHRGVKLGPVVVSAQLVAGFSVVTGPSAMENFRNQEYAAGKGDPTLLYYLGPEVALRSAARPDLEYVYRLHHRSGGWHTLGNMRGGNNAQVFGLRWRF